MKNILKKNSKTIKHNIVLSEITCLKVKLHECDS